MWLVPTVLFSNSTFLSIRNHKLYIKCHFETLHSTTCKIIKTILTSCLKSRNNTAAIVINLIKEVKIRSVNTLDSALVAQMYLVGLSHCVVRVMWFRYCILPEAVLLSSHLCHKTTLVSNITQSIINNTANYFVFGKNTNKANSDWTWMMELSNDWTFRYMCFLNNWPIR